MRRARAALARAKGGVLSSVRRGREVAWAPERMGLGNLLTLGQWASSAPDRYVLLHPARAEFIGWFPELRTRRFLTRDEVRFTDQRAAPWRGERSVRPDPDRRTAYIKDLLLPGSSVTEGPTLRGTLVVNVRRGDYYSVPEHRAEFGFNVPAYVETALALAVAEGGAPRAIHVVSDDGAWCAERLGALLEGVASVTYAQPGAAGHFNSVVRAERLIITNSTFSYWGGFVGDVRRPGRQVVVPWLFSRSLDGGDSGPQISADWRVVESIPGGWGPPDA